MITTVYIAAEVGPPAHTLVLMAHKFFAKKHIDSLALMPYSGIEGCSRG